MKLAFTTLGCPKWTIDEIIHHATENGYAGVDFRGYQGEMDLYKLKEFTTGLLETKRKFNVAGLEIPCFSSSVRLFTNTKKETEGFLEELDQYGKLCKAFHTPYIRVFGGEIGETSRDEALRVVSSNLDQMVKVAERHQVTLLLETHDDWTKCEYLGAVLEKADSPYLQVLWDIHHPFRTVGEVPERTWQSLGGRIKYTHWKDSYVDDSHERGYQLCLLGEGDIPLRHIYQLLKEEGYDGYFTLEWEKVWCPEIEEPEVAFKQYAEFMREVEMSYFNRS